MTTLKELKEAAIAATHKDWSGVDADVIHRGPYAGSPFLNLGFDDRPDEDATRKDLDFIALANPKMILMLIELIEGNKTIDSQVITGDLDA